MLQPLQPVPDTRLGQLPHSWWRTGLAGHQADQLRCHPHLGQQQHVVCRPDGSHCRVRMHSGGTTPNLLVHS